MVNSIKDCHWGSTKSTQSACGINTNGLITKSGNLLLNKLSAKLTQLKQHTLAALLTLCDDRQGYDESWTSTVECQPSKA